MAETPTELRSLHDSFTGQVKRTLDLVGLAVREVARLPASLNLAKAVRDLEVSEGKQVDTEEIERLEKLLPKVADERGRGFTLFYGLAAIAIWSTLEAHVEDLLLTWLGVRPDLLASDPIRKLKISIGDYESLAPEDRRRYILECLERDTGAALRIGVGRFETVLEQTGLPGAVSPELRRLLLELSEVRNALLHRNGRADQRLSARCPWLNATVGAPLAVSEYQMLGYGLAAATYGSEIYRRMLVALVCSTEQVDSLLASLRPGIAAMAEIKA